MWGSEVQIWDWLLGGNLKPLSRGSSSPSQTKAQGEEETTCQLTPGDGAHHWTQAASLLLVLL